MKQVFSSDMKQRRNAKGMTQQEVADAVDRSKDYIWKIETGKILPSTDVLLSLARLLGGLRFEKDGVECVMMSESEPSAASDDDGIAIPADSLGANDLIARGGVESAQLADKARQLGANIVAMRLGTKRGRTFRVALIKEALEAFHWLAAFVRRARLEFPDDYDTAAKRVQSGFADEFGEVVSGKGLQVA